MIKPIVTDPILLSRPSAPATAADLQVMQDLLDTLEAKSNECVGLAANMIGVLKQVIVVDYQGGRLAMFNPRIIRQSNSFEAEESCLSLEGSRKTKRYQKIKLSYQNADFQTRVQNFEGFTAQIIQHQIDHCNGILI